MKVACDFISLENLARTECIASELRLQRLIFQGDDVLQLHTVLWYAWRAVTIAEANTGKDCGNWKPLYFFIKHSLDFTIVTPSKQSDASTTQASTVSTLSCTQSATECVHKGSCASIGGVYCPTHAERRKKKIQAQRAAKAYGPRQPSASHDYDCPHPLCLGRFNRGGLLDHL